MSKAAIFPCSLLLALLVLVPGAWASNEPDAEAVLRAKKPGHEQALKRIEAERLAFQRDLAQREEACLKRFYSAGCVEDIRTEHLREMRRFDLAREVELQALRNIDAELRSISRERRIQEKSKGQVSG